MLSVESLIDAFWGELPPATAREQVHNQVSRLRRVLRECGQPDVIDTVGAGYRLASDPNCVDVVAVHTLRAKARAMRVHGELAESAAVLRGALAVWTGVPLGGVTGHLATTEVGTLEELRLAVTEECLDAELESGRAKELVPELTALAKEHPLCEPLHRLRMLALYRSGRLADALAAFGELQTTLREELGVDPSPQLRNLHAWMLRAGSVERLSRPPPGVVPAQLPPRLRHFVGREAELARLRQLLAEADPTGAPRVALVTGMAGIGKTSAAIHAAGAVQDLYPDGQLYVDLRGCDARPLHPSAVLADFLRALGAEVATLPADLAGRAAEFRTRTTPRRLLILLDNAADEAQIEPLLPADPACATLITSRSVLAGLDAPVRIALAPMADDLARRVLADAAGCRRLDGDDGAVRQILRACAGMPLALRIVGARLATSPELSPAILGAQLSADRSLNQMAAGNKSVQASLDASYLRLPTLQQQALCALARLRAPVFGSWVLAACLDISMTEADQVIADLARVNLVEPAGPSSVAELRYRFHDVVGAYALAQSDRMDAGDGPRRVTEWAIALSALAHSTARPERAPTEAANGVLARLEDNLLARVTDEPRSWVAAHWPALDAIMGAAIDRGDVADAGQLLANVVTFIVRLDLLEDCEAAARRLYDAAGAELSARAVATLALGQVGAQRGRHPYVVALARDLLRDVEALGDRTRLDALIMLGTSSAMCDDTAQTLDALGAALDIARRLGDVRAEFQARFGLAEIYRTGVGDLDTAWTYGRQALRIADGRTDLKDRAMARFSLVRLYLARGEVEPTRKLAAEALELCRSRGDRVGEAWCLLLTADSACAAGDLPAALQAAEESICLARRLRRPDAEASAEVALARTLAAAGDLAAARAAGKRAMELTTEFDSPVERRKVELLMSDLSAATG